MANGWMGDTKLVRDRIRKQWEAEYERAKIRQKHQRKRYEHQKKTYEARKKWFKKHGGDIKDEGFVVIDDDLGITASMLRSLFINAKQELVLQSIQNAVWRMR